VDQYWIIGLVLVSVAADALRDAWYGHESYWRYHIPKYLAFIPPLAALLFLHVSWWLWLPVAAVSWIVWRVTLRRIGGKNWPSVWGRVFRWLK